jgi:hypothetical protein
MNIWQTDYGAIRLILTFQHLFTCEVLSGVAPGIHKHTVEIWTKREFSQGVRDNVPRRVTGKELLL